MAHRHHVCPSWWGYFLLNPLRRWRQNPSDLLAPHVREGMTVLEPGPGMGFFTLELARRVGKTGRVIAVEIQTGMLNRLRQRAVKAGLLERMDLRLASPDSLNVGDLKGRVDFTLAFAMVHETPDVGRFFSAVHEASRPGASLLLAEPTPRVKATEFDEELQAAANAGFRLRERVRVSRSLAALLEA